VTYFTGSEAGPFLYARTHSAAHIWTASSAWASRMIFVVELGYVAGNVRMRE
jgi:hypothetical protein